LGCEGNALSERERRGGEEKGGVRVVGIGYEQSTRVRIRTLQYGGHMVWVCERGERYVCVCVY
jgi:hypothetical protein